MSILVTAATHKELEPFLKEFPEAEVLITGVGMPVAIFELTVAMQQKRYQWVLQVGIAGAYEIQFIGKAFVVAKDCFGDVGVWEEGKMNSLFEMGFADADAKPFTNGWIENEQIGSFTTYPVADAVTVATISNLTDWNDTLNKQFGASIESMEGAALHYVCSRCNQPFLQIRGISNQVGERNKSKWNIDAAIASSNQLLAEIYKKLKQN